MREMRHETRASSMRLTKCLRHKRKNLFFALLLTKICEDIAIINHRSQPSTSINHCYSLFTKRYRIENETLPSRVPHRNSHRRLHRPNIQPRSLPHPIRSRRHRHCHFQRCRSRLVPRQGVPRPIILLGYNLSWHVQDIEEYTRYN